DGHTATAFLLDHALGFFRVLVLIQVSDRKIRSFAGKGDGDGSSDAAVAAGDKRNLAVQFARAMVQRVLRLWARRHFGLDTRLSRLLLRRTLSFRHASTPLT